MSLYGNTALATRRTAPLEIYRTLAALQYIGVYMKSYRMVFTFNGIGIKQYLADWQLSMIRLPNPTPIVNVPYNRVEVVHMGHILASL